MRYLSALACAIAIAATAACGGSSAYPSSPSPVSVGATGTFDYYDDYPSPYDPYPPAPVPPAPVPPPLPSGVTIAPTYGPSAGGTAVTIVGNDFAQGAAVMFGTAAATSVTVASSTTITAMTPAAAAEGWVDVLVVNPGGAMYSLPGGFTYAADTAPDTVATITITAAGASPKAIQIAAGSRVRFVNNDVRPHDLRSDPHPLHTDCPELNEAGFLVPGANAQTGAFALPRTCGFHDHNDGTNPAWMGRIVIR